MKHFTPFRIHLILGFALLTRLVSAEPVIVWTNQPDMAFFAEIYNVIHDDAVIVRYKPNLAASLVQDNPEADCVIGDYIATPTLLDGFLPLNHLVNQIQDRPFEALTTSIMTDDTVRLLPVSYALPAIRVNPFARLRLDPIFIRTETITVNARKFNRFDRDGSAVALAFVPRYNPVAKYYLLRMNDTVFEVDTTQEVSWDDERLIRNLSGLASWVEEICGSREAEMDFMEKYLYDPVERQFERNRLAFAFTSSTDILDWEKDSPIVYRWPADEEYRVPILDNVVWAGIPAGTDSEEEALAFLDWLFNRETQELLIRSKIERRISRFGLFGGFSTIHEVNTQFLSVLYPELAGRIVPEELLLVPPVLPRYWNESMQSILLPLLQDVSVSPEDFPAILHDRMFRWYRQRGD